MIDAEIKVFDKDVDVKGDTEINIDLPKNVEFGKDKAEEATGFCLEIIKSKATNILNNQVYQHYTNRGIKHSNQVYDNISDLIGRSNVQLNKY